MMVYFRRRGGGVVASSSSNAAADNDVVVDAVVDVAADADADADADVALPSPSSRPPIASSAAPSAPPPATDDETKTTPDVVRRAPRRRPRTIKDRMSPRWLVKAATSPASSSISCARKNTCHGCRLPITGGERHINYIPHDDGDASGPLRFHLNCFVCRRCDLTIDPTHQDCLCARSSSKSGGGGGNGCDGRSGGGRGGGARTVDDGGRNATSTKTKTTTRNDGGGRRGGMKQRLASSNYGDDDGGKGMEGGGGGVVDGGNNDNDERNDARGDDDMYHPFHPECFAVHFGYVCVVCDGPLPITTAAIAPTTPTDASSDNDRSATAYVTTNDDGGGGVGGVDRDANANVAGGGRGVDDIDSNANMPPRRSTMTVQCMNHPFFATERMCPDHHRDSAARRCDGCQRYEPSTSSTTYPNRSFVDLGDGSTGRCVCRQCHGAGVVMTSDNVVPLWDKVVDFFEGPLGLLTSEDSHDRANTAGGGGGGGVTRRDLINIPILVVGMESMNEYIRSNYDNANDTRGHSSESSRRYTPPRGGGGGGGVRDKSTMRGLCLSERRDGRWDIDGTGGGIDVTAILCLSGLPSDLTASILAREAFHAWMKLHPLFSDANALPPDVEEGLAQLVAHLFLSDGLDPTTYATTPPPSSSYRDPSITTRGLDGNNEKRGKLGKVELSRKSRSMAAEEDDDGMIPWEARLREYFKFCIEIDEGALGGRGYRAAARAHATLGLEELLYYVALNRDFPT